MSGSLSLIHNHRIVDASAPVIHLIHGRAGNVDVMSIFRRAVPESWNILQVQAPLKDPIGGYSWWRITDGSLDPQAAKDASHIFLQFREEALAFYDLTPKYEVGIGFSQGAGLLSVLLQTKPELFRGVGLMAGFVVELWDISSASPIGSRPEVFWAHGEQDPVIKFSRAKRGASYLESLGFDVHFVSDEVEHRVGRSGMRELKVWLEELSEKS